MTLENRVERPGRKKPDVPVEPAARHDVTLLSEDDLFLFNEGTHNRLYEKLGSHPTTVEGVDGTYFAVWAPNAREVSVIGDFNSWNPSAQVLAPRGQSGIWEGFIPGMRVGGAYKYFIVSRASEFRVEKADPYAYLRIERTPLRLAPRIPFFQKRLVAEEPHALLD